MARADMKRQDVDVHVSACHQHISAADERRTHDAISDDVDLPNCREVQDVAFDYDIADHKNRERDKKGGKYPRHARQKGHNPNVNIHGRRLLPVVANTPEALRPAGAARRPATNANYFTASASSISFWPFGTSLANWA